MNHIVTVPTLTTTPSFYIATYFLMPPISVLAFSFLLFVGFFPKGEHVQLTAVCPTEPRSPAPPTACPCDTALGVTEADCRYFQHQYHASPNLPQVFTCGTRVAVQREENAEFLNGDKYCYINYWIGSADQESRGWCQLVLVGCSTLTGNLSVGVPSCEINTGPLPGARFVTSATEKTPLWEAEHTQTFSDRMLLEPPPEPVNVPKCTCLDIGEEFYVGPGKETGCKIYSGKYEGYFIYCANLTTLPCPVA